MNLKDIYKLVDKIDNDKLHITESDNVISISCGCDLNHLEAEKVVAMIKNRNNNYKVCLINTCFAYKKFIDITKKVIEYTLDNIEKDYKVFLIGCGANFFKEMFPELTAIEQKDELNIENYNIPKEESKIIYEDKPFGKIKIQDGCNNQCSYCYFPQIWGHRSVSKTKEQILQEVEKNLKAGIFTITLTGVNICQYQDPNDSTGLIDLIKLILKTYPQIRKMYLFSIDPAYEDIFKLMDYIITEPKLSNDLYIATQSGSDNVLKKMNRKHNVEKLKKIIFYSDKINVRQDFLLGHPGETEEDFLQTKNILRMAQSNDVIGGMSTFKAHEKTASFYMPDQVDEQTKDDRFNRLHSYLMYLVNLIQQEVKCIQFELWHNCTNECEFCYLNGCRKVYTEEQKRDSIKKVLDILETNKIDGFNATGLIGGELFGQQLRDPETQELFLSLIRKMKSFLVEDKMKEVWLTSNLMTDDLSPLIKTLEILLEDLPKYQRVMICTSYDTKGRFHTKESYDRWYNNLLKIRELFPRLCIHIQTICTQAFVDEWFENKEKFVDFIDRGFLMDFKPPATNAVDFIYYNTGLESFRQNLTKFAKTQSYKYLIEDREKFMKFWESIAMTFPDGVQKLKDFITNHVKSECCYSVPWDEWFIDRWDNNKENAPCGHCWDGFSYKDYPDKCCKCDVEKLIKIMESK